MGTTLVVLASDHGEALGEHDAIGHGWILWQPVLHVPLIIRVPEARTPKRIAGRVGLIDVTPTILDLLGVPIPQNLAGRSLAAALRGEPLAPRRYFAEVRSLGEQQFDEAPDVDHFAVFDSNLKAIWSEGSFRFFDLVQDPEELDGGAPDPDDPRHRELVRLLAAYWLSVQESPASELEAEDIEELRALGYLP